MGPSFGPSYLEPQFTDEAFNRGVSSDLAGLQVNPLCSLSLGRERVRAYPVLGAGLTLNVEAVDDSGTDHIDEAGFGW